jgi:hypothetical protein
MDDFPVLSITEDQGKLSAFTTAGDVNFDLAASLSFSIPQP